MEIIGAIFELQRAQELAEQCERMARQWRMDEEEKRARSEISDQARATALRMAFRVSSGIPLPRDSYAQYTNKQITRFILVLVAYARGHTISAMAEMLGVGHEVTRTHLRRAKKI